MPHNDSLSDDGSVKAHHNAFCTEKNSTEIDLNIEKQNAIMDKRKFQEETENSGDELGHIDPDKCHLDNASDQSGGKCHSLHKNMDKEGTQSYQPTNAEENKQLLLKNSKFEEAVDESHSQIKQDGGYGWVIVVCSLLVFMTYGANWIMFSIYMTDFCEVFDKPQAYIGIIGSVDAAFSQLTALPTGAFVSLYGCRPVCITALLVYATGTFLSAFATNFYSLLITFGVIKGIGAGMVYIPCSVIVQQYFTKRRALAVAFSSGGLSLGTMIFSPIHRLLIQTFGWRGGLMLHSGIVIQAIVFAAMFLPPDIDLKIRQKLYKVKNTETQNQSMAQTIKKSYLTIAKHVMKSLSLVYLKEAKFVLFISMRIFGMFGTIAMYKFSVTRAVYMGVDKMYAAFLVTCIGSGSSTFRYIGGCIANIRGVDIFFHYTIASCLCGVVVMISTIATSEFYTHAVFSFLYGAVLGMSECLLPTIASDLFGVERLPSTLGWTMAFTGLLALAYMPFYGWLYDVTSSYQSSFLLGGAVQIIAGSCGFIIMLIKYYEKSARMERYDVPKAPSKPIISHLEIANHFGGSSGTIDTLNIICDTHVTGDKKCVNEHV